MRGVCCACTLLSSTVDDALEPILPGAADIAPSHVVRDTLGPSMKRATAVALFWAALALLVATRVVGAAGPTPLFRAPGGLRRALQDCSEEQAPSNDWTCQQQKAGGRLGGQNDRRGRAQRWRAQLHLLSTRVAFSSRFVIRPDVGVV